MEDSSNSEVALRTDPDKKLRFTGVFSEAVATRLRLINSSDKIVCFKVKTTAPTRYTARPNYGVVAANSCVEVIVNLLPANQSESGPKKHKLMVQYLPTSQQDFTNIRSLWRNAPKECIMKVKLGCEFQTPDGICLSTDHINAGNVPIICSSWC